MYQHTVTIVELWYKLNEKYRDTFPNFMMRFYRLEAHSKDFSTHVLEAIVDYYIKPNKGQDARIK